MNFADNQRIKKPTKAGSANRKRLAGLLFEKPSQ
jgi:hypothetical protein